MTALRFDTSGNREFDDPTKGKGAKDAAGESGAGGRWGGGLFWLGRGGLGFGVWG